jgi:hypothetical protein
VQPLLHVARKTKSRYTARRTGGDLVSESLDQIATILLRIGLDSPAAEQLLRRAFIGAACRSGLTRNHRPTQSQIASLAGVSRLEVRNALKDLGDGVRITTDRNSRIARVIDGWRNDAKYSLASGVPRALSFRGARSEFSSLVKDYGRDVTTRTLQTQLIMLGFAKERADKLCLAKFNPSTFRKSAASADLQFVASQLANIDFELGRREYVTRRISISAGERKSAEAVRQIAQSRLLTVLSSLESMSTKMRNQDRSSARGGHRVIVSTTVAVESEELE